MSWKPTDYLAGMGVEATAADRDLTERCELAEVERANPGIRANSSWVWGDQVRICDDPFTGEPHHLPAQALLNGVLIEGRSGTRKSSGVIDPLAAEVIGLGLAPKVLVVSFKPSMTSFANAAIEAARGGYRFRYVTTVPGKPSYGLPLLHSFRQLVPDSLELVDKLLMAMALFFGAGHGPTYFYETKRRALAYSLASALPAGGAWTFGGLARVMAAFDPPPAYRTEFEKSRTELLNTLFLLAACDAINCRPGDDRALIDFPRFVLSDAPEVLYVEADVDLKRTVSFLLPQLLLAMLLAAVNSLPETDQVRLVVFVDEAAEIPTEQVARMIQRLRSRGVAFVFAYQHPGQLVQNGRDYTMDFEGYASTKIYLSLEDADRLEFYRLFAGEELRVTGTSYRTAHDADPAGGDLEPRLFLPDEYYGTKSIDKLLYVDRRAEARTVSVGPRPRLSVNDCLALFSKPGYGLVRSSTDRDLWWQSGMLVPAHFPFHITKRERDRRRALPWPAAAGTRPVVYTDEFARFLADTKTPEPTVAQGSGWEHLFDKGKRRKPR